MSVAVLTAVTGATWEADLVSSLGRSDLDISIVGRCVDLADLLAAAAAGTARAVLLSAELRRLDRDAVVRLTATGVAIVGLVTPGDEIAERTLHQLGVARVLPADAAPAEIAAKVRESVAALTAPGAEDAARRLVADPRPKVPESPVAAAVDPAGPPAPGRVIAVWGPTGAPGRTTVAVGVADEAARLGVDTLLIDADVYGGVVAQVLGLLDESPGLAAAARQALTGSLDARALDRIALRIGDQLRVLTGIARPERWPEVAGSAMEVVIDVVRRCVPFTVIDCGFSIEADEELSYDTVSPRRNGATLAALAEADVVLCVGGADPVALQRLVRALSALAETVDRVRPEIIINRLRKGVIPGEPTTEIAAALRRYAGVEAIAYLPNDPAATDAALALGKTLAEVSSGSPLRSELTGLARRLARVPAARTRARRKA